jgi:protein-S-isoprenylcysteine O-methyltransferase Ste14
VRTAVVLYVAGLVVIIAGLSSILLGGWLAALLVIAGIAIYCVGIAAEERGYRESGSRRPRRLANL